MNKKLHLKIDGMSCTTCVESIEKTLNKLAGVLRIEVNYKTGKGVIEFDDKKIEKEKIIKEIEKIEFSAVEIEDAYYTEEVGSFNKLLLIGAVLFIVFIIINKNGGFDFIPNVDQSMGYGILFVVGLLTSLHCIAMCGGINISQTVGCQSKGQGIKAAALYNFGRVISYTIIGGVVGALGSIFSFSGSMKGIIAIAAGVIMIFIGINMLNIFPILKKIHFILPFSKKFIENGRKKGPLYVGLLNGLMPCGPLQTMQIYALGTGSFVAGALSMFFFSLGTVPLMLGFGVMASFLSRKFTNNMLKVSAVLIIFLGLIMANRGLALGGINVTANATQNIDSTVNEVGGKNANTAKTEGDIQTLTTSLNGGGYPDITVKAGIPVKWNLSAVEGDINGCNRTLVIPEYGIQKDLLPGDNYIEFTPTKEGNIGYSCWMGMIQGNIKVIK